MNQNPPAQMAVTGHTDIYTLAFLPVHWTRTTLDGLGRVIKTETGAHPDYTNALSIVDTVYAPCACSPTGKMVKVSQPYAPGGTPVWTVYTYDGLGRTLSVLAADGASTSSSVYQGNTVKVTDAAGKWKTTTSDVQGNVTLVTEPDPGGQAASSGCMTAPPMGGPMQTCYQYDVLEHLVTVQMPRNSVAGNYTQTRTFTYDPATTNLVSETHPESGTTTYTYSSDLVTSKTDARGQKTQYTYDTYGRVVSVSRSPQGHPVDICQSTTYVYDVNPYHPNASAWGRLAASYTGDPSCVIRQLSSQQQQFFEDYSYTPGGLMNGRGLHLTRTTTDTRGTLTNNYVWNVGVTYNTEGSPLTVKYPDLIDFSGNTVTNHTVTYTYDGLNRPSTYQGDLLGNSLGDSFNAITGVTYNAASQPTATHYSFQRGICCGNDFWEYRSYNAMNQVTAINNGIGVSQVYGYTQGANNGQISSMTDYYLNQTITYGYDALKRLVSANAQGGTNAWGQAYQYDGFGNLNTKQVTAGSAMSWSRLIDPATNRVGGECYDANGNAGCNSTYDVANRLTGSGLAGQSGDTYMYNAGNQRVSVVRDSFQTIYFYGARGEKLATFNVGEGSYPTYMANNVYFGGRLVERGNSFVGVDRLGTVRSAGGYFPYGEEMTSPPAAGDTEKFATYTRDSSTTGLDYANQRFYSSVAGRFMSPDPYRAGKRSGDPSVPQSWNRFAYVQDDPINNTDRNGLFIDTPSLECAGTGGDWWDCPMDPGPDPGPPPPPPADVPCEINATIINSYIGSTSIYGNPKLSKPLAGLGQSFIDAALQYNTNPAVLVAIAFQESHWGYDQRNSGTNNAFGLMHADGSFLTFDNWSAGIFSATKSVDSAYNRGFLSVSDLYSGQIGGYCTAADCPKAVANLEKRVRALGEDPDYLGFDCVMHNGVLVKKQ